jgi:ATP-binding cassette, subfamily B, bacterial HlyB/CyaB
VLLEFSASRVTSPWVSKVERRVAALQRQGRNGGDLMTVLVQRKQLAAPFGGGLRALEFVAAAHGKPATPGQIMHQLALGNKVVAADDIVRAAKTIGLKARIIHHPNAKRLCRIPVPAIIRLRAGGWAVLAARATPGAFKVIDPPTKEAEETNLEGILDRIDRDVILIAKPPDPASDPATFGLSWFLSSIKRYRRSLVHVLVASFFIQIFGLVTPLIFQLVIDKVLVHKSASTLIVLVAAMVLLSVFGAVLKYLRSYALAHTSNRIDVELGAKLVSHLFRLSVGYFEVRPAGMIVTRIRELETIRNFLTGQGLTSIIDFLFIFVFIGVLFLYSPRLTLITLMTAPLYVSIAASIRPAFRSKIKEKFNRWSFSQSLVVESVVRIQTLKASAIEPLMQRQWEERFAAYVRTGFEATVLAAGGQGSMEFVTKLTTALILYFGAEQVIDGSMTVGALVAFNMIANQVTQPILRISQLWQDFQQMQISVERLGDIFNEPIEQHAHSISDLPPPCGSIELRDVTFRYRPDTRDAVKNISLSMNAGEVIGIIGASGSGKSTLTKLLQRLHVPQKGEIRLDGVDIAQIDPAWLRRQLGVVLQENLLFNRTIHENIALARPHMRRAEVMRVARLAGADEFISKLPHGYDTAIQERGANLSGGQRQRIAIARALATDPRILILDEATSALDYESERVIQTNMREIVKGRTVIIIAHRLAAVRACDRIIGMREGEIVETGTHEDLLRQGTGLYARLWSLQTDRLDR